MLLELRDAVAQKITDTVDGVTAVSAVMPILERSELEDALHVHVLLMSHESEMVTDGKDEVTVSLQVTIQKRVDNIEDVDELIPVCEAILLSVAREDIETDDAAWTCLEYGIDQIYNRAELDENSVFASVINLTLRAYA